MTAKYRFTTGAQEVVEELDGTVTEYSYITPDEETMRSISRFLFEEHWRDIIVGPCIEGSVFEIRFEQLPKMSYLDGYLTVNLGYWHFHLCIGTHKGTPSEELREKRQVSMMALFESKKNRCIGGSTYGLRMWNGFAQQMITVFLPNPKLSDEMKVLKEPQWERLSLWYEMKNKFLGEPMPESFAPIQAAVNQTVEVTA
ncbi:hypothetical protein L0222_24960 [bacterium]|nr:hypothetical protein [bacterium]MCI0602264.1 hypothetical protein [bacterium]